jgi:hypothetical protein
MSKEIIQDLKEYLNELTENSYNHIVISEKSEEVSGENNPLSQFLKGKAEASLEFIKEINKIIERYEDDEDESEYDW